MLQQVGFGVKFIKYFNELNFLRFIKNLGPFSRADRAKKKQFSKAAVSEIVSRLLQNGYVYETGVGKSTLRGGRRPILLTFNQKAGFVISLEIKHTYSLICLLDMNAKIYKTHTITFPLGTLLKEVVNQIIPLIHEILQITWVKGARPIGIGIGVPGLIDYKGGCIKMSNTLKSWENIPICSMFENEFNMRTVLENDVKIFTLGECLFGRGEGHQNLVNLYIGDGIGAGIFLNGMLIRGVTASAGEIGYSELGYFVTDLKNFPLLYNKQVSYGEILSHKWLLRAAEKAISKGYDTALKAHPITPVSIVSAAENGDTLAKNLLNEYATILGSLCINLINILNIELLIISGQIVSESDYLIHQVEEKIHEDLLRIPADATKIFASSLMENGIALGAVGLVLEDLFYQDTINVSKYRSIFK